jgi:hypothetical protein
MIIFSPQVRDHFNGKSVSTTELENYVANHVDQVLASYGGKGFAEFKRDLAELAVAVLGPIGTEMRRLTSDTSYVDGILRRGAERVIAERLGVLPGVARVRFGGARRYAMRVWIDREALAARQLTVTDVDSGEAHTAIQSVTNDYGTFAVDANGNWSFTTPPLADGEHTFQASATDTAGNIGIANNLGRHLERQ